VAGWLTHSTIWVRRRNRRMFDQADKHLRGAFTRSSTSTSTWRRRRSTRSVRWRRSSRRRLNPWAKACGSRPSRPGRAPRSRWACAGPGPPVGMSLLTACADRRPGQRPRWRADRISRCSGAHGALQLNRSGAGRRDGFSGAAAQRALALFQEALTDQGCLWRPQHTRLGVCRDATA
jgi:hypothetical protein